MPGIQGLLNKPRMVTRMAEVTQSDLLGHIGSEVGQGSLLGAQPRKLSGSFIHTRRGKVKCCSHKESPFIFEMTELDQRLRMKRAL